MLWENYPSDETPLNESNLNKMDAAIGVIDDRVITLDTTKATKTEVATLVADVTFEESTGIITITKKNGSKVMIDTQMEKIAINFEPDYTADYFDSDRWYEAVHRPVGTDYTV